MMFEDLPRPIVVLGAPRSGTSLTAGLFAMHGAWAGDCKPADRRNARGYFENLRIKSHLLAMAGRLVTRCRVAEVPPKNEFRDRVLDTLEREDYAGGPWVVKHSALYAPLWMRDFDPIFVCCFRHAAHIQASGDYSGMIDKNTSRATINEHHRYMRQLVNGHEAHEVWPEHFVNRHWTDIIGAFFDAGMAFDHEIAEEFVDPALWHDWTRRHATA